MEERKGCVYVSAIACCARKEGLGGGHARALPLAPCTHAEMQMQKACSGVSGHV